jgi:hypothetical protein
MASNYPEHSRVALQEDLPGHGLSAGDVETVVTAHHHRKGYEVEFCTLFGENATIVSLSPQQIRSLRPNELAHARELATAS